ncbi:UNVERIFIED_CONTAM: hypothetical protein FKN15_050083 [Acipenser sinensis]
MGKKSRQRQRHKQQQQQLPPQLEDPASLFPLCSWCGREDHRWRSCPDGPPADWCGRCEVDGHSWAGCPHKPDQEQLQTPPSAATPPLPKSPPSPPSQEIWDWLMHPEADLFHDLPIAINMLWRRDGGRWEKWEAEHHPASFAELALMVVNYLAVDMGDAPFKVELPSRGPEREEPLPSREPEGEPLPSREPEGAAVPASASRGSAAAAVASRGTAAAAVASRGTAAAAVASRGTAAAAVASRGTAAAAVASRGTAAAAVASRGTAAAAVASRGTAAAAVASRGTAAAAVASRGTAAAAVASRGTAAAAVASRGTAAAAVAWGLQGSCFAWGRYTVAGAPRRGAAGHEELGGAGPPTMATPMDSVLPPLPGLRLRGEVAI